MAKDAKAEKAKGKEAPKAKADEPEFKYGVEDLAKMLNIKDTSVRVQLRAHNVKKAGKSYGWNTKDELQAVADKLKAPKKAAKAPADKKGSKKD